MNHFGDGESDKLEYVDKNKTKQMYIYAQIRISQSAYLLLFYSEYHKVSAYYCYFTAE
jgi:hypothetical protein